MDQSYRAIHGAAVLRHFPADHSGELPSDSFLPQGGGVWRVLARGFIWGRNGGGASRRRAQGLDVQ